MNNIQKLIITAASLCGLTPLMALDANINWGSASENPGAATFFGSDGGNADSIALGFFAGDTPSADLTGWTAIVTDSIFEAGPGGGVNFGANAVYDVTAASGLDAWILIVDDSLSGLIRLDSWVDYSGTVSPATPPNLNYDFGTSALPSNVTTLAGAGTAFVLTDNGGFGGDGLGIQLTAVPEPAAYAMLSGLLALSWVMVRRRA